MKLTTSSTCLLCIQLAFSIPIFSQVDMKSDVSVSQIDSLFAPWNDMSKPGIAVGIVVNGEIKHVQGYGSAHLEHNIPITAKTTFQYTGMSDQIIAFGILLLNDRQHLRLDDNIRFHLPTLPEYMNDIKIHHLLSHTSGLYDMGVLRQFAGWQENDVFRLEDKNQMMQKMTILNDPVGSHYLATEMETKLLQDLIEKVTAKSLQEFAAEWIFKPLGMANSVFTKTVGELVANRAQGYVASSESYHAVHPIEDHGQTDLFYSTVEDMAKWAQHLSDPRVGSADLIRQFESFVTVDGAAIEEVNTSQYIGQHRYWDFKGTKKLYLIGMQNGYACKLVRFPDQDLSIVVMGNAGSYNGHWSSFVADLYLQKYYETPVASGSTEQEYITLTADQMAQFVGSYWNDTDLYTTQVSIENDTLRYFEEEFNYGMDLIPVSKNGFTASTGHKVEFSMNSGKKVLTLTMPSGNEFTSIKYAPESALSQVNERYVGLYTNVSLDADFQITMEEGELVLTHFKLGKHRLIPIGENTYKTNEPVLKQIKFVSTSDGQQQLEITNRTVKNFPFAYHPVLILK